jgi:hypothetical protein
VWWNRSPEFNGPEARKSAAFAISAFERASAAQPKKIEKGKRRMKGNE